MSDDNWDIISDNLDLDQIRMDFSDVHHLGRESTPEECVDEFKRLRRLRKQDRRASWRYKLDITLLVILGILCFVMFIILGGILWR